MATAGTEEINLVIEITETQQPVSSVAIFNLTRISTSVIPVGQWYP